MANDRVDLSQLAAFELAAQRGSFTQAARELGLSQPAFSHRMRALEDGVGRRLFARQHRGVTLTGDGEMLYEAVSTSLRRIRRVLDRFRQDEVNQRIRISLDFAFGALWLMPRLAASDLAPDNIDLQISSGHLSPSRHMQNSDIAFVLAEPEAVPAHAIKLFREEVVPICSPAFLEQHPEAVTPGAVLGLPLLHNVTPVSDAWMTWHDWATASGLDWAPTGSQSEFTTYQFVLQAVLAGRGLALGWHGLIDDLLRSGQVVVPVSARVRSRRWYLAVLCSDAPAAREFLEEIARAAVPS